MPHSFGIGLAMLGPLFLILTVVPFLELYILFKVGNIFGFGNTLLLIIVSGFLGAYFLKKQGGQILREAQTQVSSGQAPTKVLIKGLLTFIGGVLMLTPGFITDGLGLSFVFPLTQLIWVQVFSRWVKKGIQSGSIHVFSGSMGTSRGPQGPQPRPQSKSVPGNSEVIDIKVNKRS